MEEDIKNLQEVINLCNEELDNKDNNVTAVLDLTDLLSLKNLIKTYKELEEENLSKQKAYDDCYCDYKHYRQFESIPKQVVEDKIENLKSMLKATMEGKLQEYTPEEIIIKVNTLEELLEKGEEDE